jgi:peptidyl-prolyl cis-trans isomerase B (cyclophilin B)
MLKRSAAIVACLSVLVLAGCGQENEDAPADEATESTSESTQSTPEESASTASCDFREDGRGAAKKVDPPEAEVPATGTVTATVTTGQGDIGLTMDAGATPCTVASFVSLAEQGFYDDTPCPRIGDLEGFGILQCGDPTGTGSGGPGYSFADELSGDETYPAGTIAMANAGADTNGSQFFLVFRDSEFQPNYTVFGTIDEAGLEVLEAIAATGNDNSNPAGGGVPNEPVQIETVTIN